MPKLSSSYDWLAEYYDQVFSFRNWMEPARDQVLDPILADVRTACDLGCGTASTAIEFAREGIRMFAVDQSDAMCQKGREKVARADVPVTVICADMRSFRLPQPVDLVTCEFDALNHIPRKGDLLRVTKSVSRALRPGGYFYFDVNHRAAFETDSPLIWWMDRPGVAVVLHGGFDPRSQKGWIEVEGFIQAGKVWRRQHDRVEEVFWTREELRNALETAGFDRIRMWDATKFIHSDPSLRRGFRTFCLARKARVKTA